MKKNIIAINTIMKQYMKYICALLIIGMSASAWATHPGSNYTLVTAASSLSEGDAVILYDDVNDIGVTGSTGTSASYSATQDDWIEYTVGKPNGSTVTLQDWSLLISPYVYAEEDGNKYKFTYSTSASTSFTINSNGNLVCSTTRLAHFGEYVRFYASSGTALKVYKVGSPKVYGEKCDGNLCVSPDAINMAGEYDGENLAEIYSSLFTVTTQYKNKNHYVSVVCDDVDLDLAVYDYDYDEPFGSSGHYTPTSNTDISRLKVYCVAGKKGTFDATLDVYAYDVDGAGGYKHVSIPVTITVLEKEQECTPRTLSFANGTSAKTIYKADGSTYTNAATPSAGDGYGTVTYAVSTSSPLGCASVNSSGVVTFSEYGSATITASLGANGTYCAAPDLSYDITMECKARTLSFTSSTPSVSVTTDSYTQTATKSAGAGTISYGMVQSVGSGFAIDSETGEVTFNGNAGTATITATITADNAGGYCLAEGSYTLTVTPVVPTVSNFSYTSTENSMTLNGAAVTDNGGTAITDYGYIYSTTASAIGTLVIDGEGVTKTQVAASNIAEGTAYAEKTISALSSGVTYYVRAYATNSAGTGYSDIQTIKTVTYSNYQFSCSELTLTPHLVTAGTPIFITSTAGDKWVRSQDSILVEGSGLSISQTVTFSLSNPLLADKFLIRKKDFTELQTNASGSFDANTYVYVFYKPAVGDTDDGIDVLENITANVGGLKPKSKTLTQNIIGRHLPADFVIACKRNNKWYALPANMDDLTNPGLVEIAVDNIDNPTVAYTASTNIYNLYGQSSGAGYLEEAGQYIKLGMKNNSNKPLFGAATGTSTIKGDGTAIVTNNINKQYWWLLTQTKTGEVTAATAQYSITCANNTAPFILKENGGNPQWGFFTTGSVGPLRLIPASDIIFTEAYFVEWGQHGGVIEVDATAETGVDATSVTAHLGANSATTTLSQTQTSVKNRASIYNYTVNFGGSIDFAAAASNGALLTLEWKNGETVKAVTNIVVPKIIATSATMKSIMSDDAKWETEVHVLPGVTLTANAGDFLNKDVLIKHLEIYPGATVVVTKGAQDVGTLKVKTLVLRNGWTRAGEKAYDVARLYITPSTASLVKNALDDVWYTDWYIDYDQYYPIAVPWDVTLSGITYRYCSVEPTVGHDKNIRLRYYDGEGRASSGQSQIGQNWKLYGASGADDVPTKLEPSKGYALTAKRPSGKAFSILRMPLTIPSAAWTTGGEKGEVSGTHKDQVSVTGWGSGTAEWYAMGWNFVANPYMCTFNGDDEEGIGGKLVDQQGKGVRYATIPDVDFKNYDQVAIADANLKPASGFFIQAENPAATYVTFASSNIVPPSAPTRFKTTTEAIPEQEAYIRLSYEGGKDQMGLIIGEDYTENYEVNADLAKVLGDAGFVKTYMQYGGMDMAYVAINSMLAQQWIPVTVILPTSGEYTFSLTNSSVVEQLEGVYLIDYANDNQVTNLIDEDYVFTSEAGTIGNRFSINAIVGERQTPTDVDIIGADKDSKEPIKFLYHEKVYIYHHGIIYDATGKKVREINK